MLFNRIYSLNPKQDKEYFYLKENKIIDIKICRKPITKVIFNLLNVLSFNQFKENFKNSNYDNLFHLSLYITFDLGYKYILEKNARVNFNFNMNYLNDNNIEIINVNLNGMEIKLKNLFENTINKIGKENFFIYRSHSWNCQNFIYNILNCNNLMNQNYKDFILQDTEKLFLKLGYLKILSDKLTGLAANLDIVYQGGKIIDYKVQSVIFNKNKYNINDCKLWLKEKNLLVKKIDETEKYYRFRQYNPNYLKKLGYNDFQTIEINNDIKMIVVYR